ncbi:hypothetical protein [Candidatus Tisiphia endosymbiont of Hybos culiciformis]|uniref:hypothetical protein n=1 Tax=Candidatus Tisiphia endosymbiont of Hybos culiciformis TaxID=3139331 RepID=UPI003CCB52B6
MFKNSKRLNLSQQPLLQDSLGGENADYQPSRKRVKLEGARLDNSSYPMQDVTDITITLTKIKEKVEQIVSSKYTCSKTA